MKTLKIIGGFFLGWLAVSVPMTIVLMAAGLGGISRTSDLIKVISAFCGGLLGSFLTYKKVNQKIFED